MLKNASVRVWEHSTRNTCQIAQTRRIYNPKKVFWYYTKKGIRFWGQLDSKMKRKCRKTRRYVCESTHTHPHPHPQNILSTNTIDLHEVWLCVCVCVCVQLVAKPPSPFKSDRKFNRAQCKWQLAGNWWRDHPGPITGLPCSVRELHTSWFCLFCPTFTIKWTWSVP